MKFLVKHSSKPGRVFLSDHYVGLSADPVFAAKSDALEAYFEPYAEQRLRAPVPKVSFHGDVTYIQPGLSA